MAQFLEGRFRAIDSSGNPMSGATLTIYTANTTTPASIFRDAALATPATNPTSGSDKSDAGGWFPQLFAAEGTVVDYILKDSGGTTVKSYEDFTFVGSDTGNFARTLTGGTRVTIADSGGRVLFQVGDASPDNTGGKLTIEGWAGSQGDDLLLDFVLIDTTGRIKEVGKKLIGVIDTDATAWSAATSVVIPLTNTPTGVRSWVVNLWDIVTTTGTDTSLTVQFSYDGGGTYKSGASDYAYYFNGAGDDAHTNGLAGQNIKSLSSSKTCWCRIEVLTPNSGNGVTIAMATFGGFQNGSSVPVHQVGSSFGLGDYGRATHMKIASLVGNISGNYNISPRRGFGET